MDKSIKREAPRWNNGNAEQPSQGGSRSAKDARPLPVKSSRSRNLSGLPGYAETNAVGALDDEQSNAAQVRRSLIEPATGGPRRRALAAAPSGNHPALGAKKGPVDRFAEERIAQLNAELDAAGAGVSAAINGAPSLPMRASRSELPIVGAREIKEVSLQTLSDRLNVPVALARFEGGGSRELGTLAEPAGATATMMPEHALYRDEMRFTPQSAPAREPIQARTTNTVRPQTEGRSFGRVDGSRLGNRDVLESASRQVSAIVNELEAELRETRFAASKVLPRLRAARNQVAQAEEIRANRDARAAFDEARPDLINAYEDRIVGLREAWELAQHATRAVRRALNAAPSAQGPQTGTPEVQCFAEELAGQANHALTQLYQALEAVPKMPRDGTVS